MNTPLLDFESSRALVRGDGEMAERIRSLDWSQTALGAMETWSPALRMMVTFLLANRFPLLLWWGPDFVSLYNDAYRPVLGAKHPQALGQPVSVCWQEIWHVLKPLIETPFRGGPATWMEDIELELLRHGYAEETHFTVAYSPVPDDTVAGGIGGVLATVHEITEKVIGERRVLALRDLGMRGVEAKSAEEACALAATALRPHPKDVPFALLYLSEAGGKCARLAGRVGVESSARLAPEVLELDRSDAPWPLAEVLRSEEMQVVNGLDERFPDVVVGPWTDSPRSAAVVPIKSNHAHQLAGFLVVGVSARLRFDDRYRDFVELLATQIATGIANARAYEEERRRADALAEIDRAKTAFFSNVSHEFRTPLTLMLGPLEDVLGRAPTTPLSAVHEELRVTHRNSLRLLKLVNALLDFSRLEAGRLTAQYEPVELGTLTAELAGMFRAAIEKAGLRFNVECPPLAEPAYVDRDLWEKIVFNLLSNALKFTLAGEIAVAVRLSERDFELVVRDTGVGIPEAELPNLFKRFHRIENVRSRTFEGTGIGLALVLELAKLHGGTVTAVSRSGEGSTFTVRLPRGRSHLPAEHVVAESSEIRPPASEVLAESYLGEALHWLPDPPAPAAAAAPLDLAAPVSPAGQPRPRIILADDNADMREHVRRVLGPTYSVEAYADGAAALAAIHQQRPDLVLTDVMMPRLDGFGLLKAIRSDATLQSVPVIILSARAGNEASAEGYDAGADDYLVKPFTARELVTRVNAHLKMTRLRSDISTQTEILAAIVASSNDAIISKNLDGIITSWNQGAQRLFGYTAAEIVGRSVLTLIPADRQDEEPMILGRLRRGERIEHYETVRRHKDGHLLHVSLTVSPLRDVSGRVMGASKIARDISERRRAERQREALHEMLARVNQAAALSDIYDAALNAILQCLDANRAAILLFDESRAMRFVAWRGLSEGYRAAVDGHSPWRPDFRHPRPICVEHVAKSDFAPALRATVEREGIQALAFIPLVYDQRLRGKLMIYYDIPHAFEAGEVHVAEAIASQVAFAVERQRSAEALESLVAERTRSLREVIAQMEEFSYSVSHDLRSPVRAMRGYAEVVLQEYGAQLDGQGRELLARIQRNGLRMDRLIQDLLTYTRISRLELKLEPVSLAKLVADVMQQYPELGPERATIRIAPGLPAVLAHEPSLGQVISNLLTNAVKFVAPGTRPVVEIGCERQDDRVRLWFADNGIAIPPQYQSRLFGMFERLHPDRGYEGTGIGLAIVRRAMERMNGRAGVISDGVAGSKFWIELPAACGTG